jgi:hypothetical protein
MANVGDAEVAYTRKHCHMMHHRQERSDASVLHCSRAMNGGQRS